ncbi:kelch repeat-containing protein [Hymenobacter norwichensis]|uniref:kelch repeat-containing protein n=1 Tax=Hymenobacter norwichensis TaxID=223903 RepID=UPI0003B34F4C|nr:kelch repeat-containing protein [Hymenobacter norwichensis]
MTIPSWTGVASLRQNRSQHAAVALANNIYVWGGYVRGANGDDVPIERSSLEIYDAATDTWRTGAPLPRVTRGQAAAAGTDGRIYSFGGAIGLRFAVISNSYQYTPSTDSWREVERMPIGQWLAEAATGNDGRIYVFGSYTQIYSPATNTWDVLGGMPTSRYGQVVIKDSNGLMHTIGGTNGTVALATHEVFNPATNRWTTAAPLPVALNQAGGTLGADGNLYVVGGKQSFLNNTAPFYNTVYVYSPTTNSWRQDTSLPITLGETKAVTIGNAIYTIAGVSGMPAFLQENQTSAVFRATLCQAPELTLPPNQAVSAAPGQCSARVAFAASATNQATLTYTLRDTPITSPYTFPVGSTVIQVTASNCAGSVSAPLVVTVSDSEAPTVLAAGLQAALVNGTRTIEAGDIDYGSFDNCGTITSMTLSKSTFTCADIGPNPVTLTVTDNANNTASQTVTVLITDNTAPVVLAAGLQVNLINGTRTIEAADIDYGSYDACGRIASLTLSKTTFSCANVGPNDVTLTVRDNAGNTSSKTVTVLVTADATCTPSARPNTTGSLALAGEVGKLQVYPNPATTEATLVFEAQQAGRAQVLVYNSLGRLVATLYDGVAQAGQRYERTLQGASLPAGLYTCRFLGQGKSVTQRLMLTK